MKIFLLFVYTMFTISSLANDTDEFVTVVGVLPEVLTTKEFRYEYDTAEGYPILEHWGERLGKDVDVYYLPRVRTSVNYASDIEFDQYSAFVTCQIVSYLKGFGMKYYKLAKLNKSQNLGGTNLGFENGKLKYYVGSSRSIYDLQCVKR